MNTKLYIDLDGVLLGKARPADTEIILAKHAREFLEYCVQNYECYWLTTHCRDGDTTRVVNTLRRYADEPLIALIGQIRPTAWKTLKTEAVDLESDFYLIDDQLLQHEVGLLEKKGVLGRWLKVDTRRNPDDLRRAIALLEKARHLS